MELSNQHVPVRKRWKRWAVGGLLGVFGCIATAVLVLFLLVDAAFVERRLNAALAAATDSLYQAEVGGVGTNVLARTFAARDVTVKPDSARLRRLQARGTAPASAAVTAGRIELSGPHLWAWLTDGTLGLDALALRDLSVDLTLSPAQNDAEGPASSPDTAAVAGPWTLRLARALPALSVQDIDVRNARLALYRVGQREPLAVFDGLDTHLIGTIIDSAAAVDSSRIAFSSEVRASVRHVEYRHGLYQLDVEGVHATSAEQTMRVERLRYAPVLSDDVLMRRRTYRLTRYRVSSGPVEVRALDMARAWRDRTLLARALNVDSLRVDAYMDKQLPNEPGTENDPETMLHTAFQRLQVPVAVDTVTISNAYVAYGERPKDGDRGTISFENTYGTIYGLANRAAHANTSPAVLNVRSQVAGVGALRARIAYDLLADSLNMQYSGGMGPAPAPAFNGAFTNISGVDITSGQVDTVAFDISVTDGFATGTLRLLYHDLDVRLVDKETKDQNLIDELRTLLAERRIQSANPQEGSTVQVAAVNHRKQPSATFFRFLWETLRSGILQTLTS